MTNKVYLLSPAAGGHSHSNFLPLAVFDTVTVVLAKRWQHVVVLQWVKVEEKICSEAAISQMSESFVSHKVLVVFFFRMKEC